MCEKFTLDGHEVFLRSLYAALNFGQGRADCRHLLWAVAGCGGPAGAILHDHGVTPCYIEQTLLGQDVRSVEASGQHLLDGLDGEALAAIGIDLDVVRARLAVLGAGAAPARGGRDGPRCGQQQRQSWVGRHVRRGAWRRIVHFRSPLWSRRANGCLRQAVREADALGGRPAGPEHVLLALLGTGDRALAKAWARARVPPASMRAAVLAALPR